MTPTKSVSLLPMKDNFLVKKDDVDEEEEKKDRDTDDESDEDVVRICENDEK